MSLRVYSCSEPITEPDILESIRALPDRGMICL